MSRPGALVCIVAVTSFLPVYSTSNSTDIEPMRHLVSSVLPQNRKPCNVSGNSTNYYNCGAYYTCSENEAWILHYCPYPQLFSDVIKKCLNFRQVSCNHRNEPKSPCGYRERGCRQVSGSCFCALHSSYPTDYAFCVNQTDGAYPLRQFYLRPKYIICTGGRTFLVGCRGNNMVFDVKTRTCKNIYNVVLEALGSTSSVLPNTVPPSLLTGTLSGPEIISHTGSGNQENISNGNVNEPGDGKTEESGTHMIATTDNVLVAFSSIPAVSKDEEKLIPFTDIGGTGGSTTAQTFSLTTHHTMFPSELRPCTRQACSSAGRMTSDDSGGICTLTGSQLPNFDVSLPDVVKMVSPTDITRKLDIVSTSLRDLVESSALHVVGTGTSILYSSTVPVHGVTDVSVSKPIRLTSHPVYKRKTVGISGTKLLDIPSAYKNNLISSCSSCSEGALSGLNPTISTRVNSDSSMILQPIQSTSFINAFNFDTGSSVSSYLQISDIVSPAECTKSKLHEDIMTSGNSYLTSGEMSSTRNVEVATVFTIFGPTESSNIDGIWETESVLQASSLSSPDRGTLSTVTSILQPTKPAVSNVVPLATKRNVVFSGRGSSYYMLENIKPGNSVLKGNLPALSQKAEPAINGKYSDWSMSSPGESGRIKTHRLYSSEGTVFDITPLPTGSAAYTEYLTRQPQYVISSAHVLDYLLTSHGHVINTSPERTLSEKRTILHDMSEVTYHKISLHASPTSHPEIPHSVSSALNHGVLLTGDQGLHTSSNDATVIIVLGVVGGVVLLGSVTGIIIYRLRHSGMQQKMTIA